MSTPTTRRRASRYCSIEGRLRAFSQAFLNGFNTEKYQNYDMLNWRIFVS